MRNPGKDEQIGMLILREQQGTLQPYFPAFLLSLFYFSHDWRRHTEHEPAPAQLRAG